MPIGISAVALVLSGFALGWNVYRDVIMKPKVVVRFAVVKLFGGGQSQLQQTGTYLNMTATNHGPGAVELNMISGKVAGFLQRMSRRVQHFVILADYTNPMNPQLPKRLDVGEVLNLYLPYDKDCFLGNKPKSTHIGISDSFGRVHYAPRKEVKVARKAFDGDHPSIERGLTG